MAALAAVVSTRGRKRAETTFEWRLARSVSARTACLARRLPISSTNQFWPDDREAPGYFDDIGWGFGMSVRIRGPYLGPSPGVSYPWAVSPTRPSTTDYAGVLPLQAPGRDRGVRHDPELAELVLLGELVPALGHRREAALRADREVVDVDVLCGLVDPRHDLVDVLELRRLRAHQAEDHDLSLGHVAQRLEPAGPVVVELEQEAVDGERAEQPLGNWVVAALGEPAAGVVSPADVHADRCALGALHAVDGRRVGGEHPGEDIILLARAVSRPYVRAQELRIGGIIELDVPDALGEKRLDLRPHKGGYLRTEFLARVVNLISDTIAPEVLGDEPRGNQRHLDVAAGDASQESGFALGNPAALLQAAGDYVRGAGQLDHAVGPMPRHLEFLCCNTVEGVDDASPEVGAPELPVGEDVEPGLLLHLDRGRDGLVLGFPKFLSTDLPGLGTPARIEQRRRPQQAPHLVAAELEGNRHVLISLLVAAARLAVRAWRWPTRDRPSPGRVPGRR